MELKEKIQPCSDCGEPKPDLNEGQCRNCSIKEIKEWMKLCSDVIYVKK
jgi:hypothetical protein